MSTSQRTLDQVKSILGKLDRNIDAARARRTQDRPTVANGSLPAPVPAPSPAPSVVPSPAPIASAPLQAAKPATVGRGSQYGRATPMRITRPTPLNNTGT